MCPVRRLSRGRLNRRRLRHLCGSAVANAARVAQTLGPIRTAAPHRCGLRVAVRAPLRVSCIAVVFVSSCRDGHVVVVVAFRRSDVELDVVVFALRRGDVVSGFPCVSVGWIAPRYQRRAPAPLLYTPPRRLKPHGGPYQQHLKLPTQAHRRHSTRSSPRQLRYCRPGAARKSSGPAPVPAVSTRPRTSGRTLDHQATFLRPTGSCVSGQLDICHQRPGGTTKPRRRRRRRRGRWRRRKTPPTRGACSTSQPRCTARPLSDAFSAAVRPARFTALRTAFAALEHPGPTRACSSSASARRSLVSNSRVSALSA